MLLIRHSLLMVLVVFVTHTQSLYASNGGSSFVDGKWEHNHDVADISFEDVGYLTGWNSRDNYNTTVDGNYGQITSAAKNPLSPGRAGLRKWVSNTTNVGTAVPTFNFGASYPELWVRYYTRYESGFAWSGDSPHYDKLFRMFMASHGSNSNVYIELQGANSMHLSTEGAVDAYRYPDPNDTQSTNHGWASLFTDNGTTSHGRFVVLEMYVKAESSVGEDDGVIRIWAKGDLIIEKTDMQFVDPDASNATAQVAGWMELYVSNQDGANNSPAGYADYDDIVIYNQTPPNTDSEGNAFIGPIAYTNENCTGGTTSVTSGTVSVTVQ